MAYDQLSASIGPLAACPPLAAGIVLVECPAKAARRPYHRQKLALLLTSMRHFAVEQAARGVAVVVLVDDSYAAAATRAAAAFGPLTMMRPAERELRVELAPLVAAGAIREVPHAGWLTTAAEFAAWAGPKAPWRMDAFYRGARRDRDILMDRGKPVGGKFSFDADNRKRWPGTPAAPAPLRFTVDAITAEVGALIEARYANHPGTLDLGAIAATAADVAAAWRWARTECLPTFGPFEDAMATRSPTLFHTLVSGLVNLHRLLPRDVVADALADDLPLASQEGFVRQVLGWREFVHHVHDATDGFRTVADAITTGAPLPPAYWGTPSGMRCLDTVVADVWRTGYSHHITRLMVLANIGTLLGVSARELTDWFWVAYTDAYDWVVEPNVLGMGTFAVGDVMTTKPYVAGSAYIDKLSDYCKGCAFDPKKTCPLPRLYWAYLDRNEAHLTGNQRMAVPLGALRRRAPAERATDAAVHARVLAQLAAGERVT